MDSSETRRNGADNDGRHHGATKNGADADGGQIEVRTDAHDEIGYLQREQVWRKLMNTTPEAHSFQHRESPKHTIEQMLKADSTGHHRRAKNEEGTDAGQ